MAGVDIIVGGHSHSLLGTERDLSLLGLIPEGSYPTETTGVDGKRVLVLQAGQWGDVVGRLQVTFSPAGEVTGYNAGAVIPVGEKFTRSGVRFLPGTQAYQDIVDALNQSDIVRIIREDPIVAALLAPYVQQVDAYRSVRVATAANDIVRGLNSGPGPLIADSMLAAVPRARVALMNFGGVRKDLATGSISEVDVQEVLPFASTMVLVDLTGAELKNSLEDGIDFLITRYPQQIPPYIPYVGGIRLTVLPSAAKGSRVGSLVVKDAGGVYQPLQDTAVYSTVVNSFVTGGGDGFTTVKNATRYRNDTGIIDSDAFREYLKGLGTVSNPVEQRITMLPDR